MARGYAQARTEAVKGLSFSPSAILTYPLESRTEAAITELESLAKQNPDIDPIAHGRYMDFYLEDGSKATFAVIRNAWDNSLTLNGIESVTGKGAGTAVMKAMVAIADKYKVPISLSVEPFTKDRNWESFQKSQKSSPTTEHKSVKKPSFEKIRSFYEKFGFKHVPDAAKFAGDYVMVRQPN
jgi:hypothetical protein